MTRWGLRKMLSWRSRKIIDMEENNFCQWKICQDLNSQLVMLFLGFLWPSQLSKVRREILGLGNNLEDVYRDHPVKALRCAPSQFVRYREWDKPEDRNQIWFPFPVNPADPQVCQDAPWENWKARSRDDWDSASGGAKKSLFSKWKMQRVRTFFKLLEFSLCQTVKADGFGYVSLILTNAY